MLSETLLQNFKHQTVVLAILLGLNMTLLAIQPSYGMMSFGVAAFMFYKWYSQSQRSSPLWITLEPKSYMSPQLLGVFTGYTLLGLALFAHFADALEHDLRVAIQLLTTLYTLGFMLVQYEALSSKKPLGYYMVTVVWCYIFVPSLVYVVVSAFTIHTTIYCFMRRRDVWSPRIQPWQSNRVNQL